MAFAGLTRKALGVFGSRASGIGAGAVGALRTTSETVAGARTFDPSFNHFLAAGVGQLGLAASPAIREAFRKGRTLKEQVDLERQEIIQTKAAMARGEAMQRAVVENLARVAALDPDLYTSIAAGRRIPRGARVIGGQVREDLLEVMGRSMASGHFEQKSPTDDFLNFVQG